MELKLDYSDALIVPRASQKPMGTRGDVDINVHFKKFSGLPIVVANMPSIGTYKIAKLLSPEKVTTFIYKDHSAEYHIENLKMIEDRSYVGITTGIRDSDVERVLKITSEIEVGFLSLDTANVYGNFHTVLQVAKLLKEKRPKIRLVVGNICTPELVEPLVNAGADLIKVGVGPGAACRTRSEVGVGMPQLSAVLDVVKVTGDYNIPIIADGGCRESGDICKALGAGATMVMLGGMFANCIECDNIKEIDGKKYVEFWGLGSRRQFEQTFPHDAKYRPNEGRDLLVPCTTSLFATLEQIKGSLRSVCTYVGASNIGELSRNVTFVRTVAPMNQSLAQYERV
jgi:GMP reductase